MVLVGIPVVNYEPRLTLAEAHDWYGYGNGEYLWTLYGFSYGGHGMCVVVVGLLVLAVVLLIFLGLFLCWRVDVWLVVFGGIGGFDSLIHRSQELD